MTEQIETRSKKVRGMAQRSLNLIEAMHTFAEAAQPITGRGVGYKLFTAGLIPSMATRRSSHMPDRSPGSAAGAARDPHAAGEDGAQWLTK